MDFIKSFVTFLKTKQTVIQVSSSDDELPENHLKDDVNEPNIVDLQSCDILSQILNENYCDAVDNLGMDANNDSRENGAASRVDNNEIQDNNNNEMETTNLDYNLLNLDEISINTVDSDANTNICGMDNVDKGCPISNTDLAIVNNLLEKDFDCNANESDVFDLDEFYNFFETKDGVSLGLDCILEGNNETVLCNDDILGKVSFGSCAQKTNVKDGQIKEEASSSENLTSKCLNEFESILDVYRAEKAQSIDSQKTRAESSITIISDVSVSLIISKEKSVKIDEQSSILKQYEVNEKRHKPVFLQHTQNAASSKVNQLHIVEAENIKGHGTKDVLYEFAGRVSLTDENKNIATSSKGNDKGLQIVSINSSKNVISISSEGDTNTKYAFKDFQDIKNVDSDSDCEGYHSSDFEFITESEAEMDGLIINCIHKKHKTPKKGRKSQVRTLELAKAASRQESRNNDSAMGPIASTSKVNTDTLQNQDPEVLKSKYESQKAYYGRLKQQYSIKEMHNSRENHVMPNNEDYIGLFRGPFAAGMDFYFAENKSVFPTTSMNAQYRGVGFDVVMSREEVDQQYQEEAKESAKRILEMYPGQNRKRRRRH